MKAEQEKDQKYIFDRIMTEHGEEIKRFILTYVKDRAVTDDLVQDVFLKVYLSLDSFEAKSSLKTWIYRIAINRCKDYFRSWHYQKVRLAKPFDFSQAQAELTPETRVLKKAAENDLVNGVLSLGLKYREVILLYYYRDFNIDEIAELLNLSPSTVRTRLKRAREQLRKKLGGDDFES